MPVLFVNAASISSSAFFIDAAANTVTVFCCANADGGLVIVHSAARQPIKRAIGFMSRSVNGSHAHTIARAGTTEFCGNDRSGIAIADARGALTVRHGSANTLNALGRDGQCHTAGASCGVEG